MLSCAPPATRRRGSRAHGEGVNFPEVSGAAQPLPAVARGHRLGPASRAGWPFRLANRAARAPRPGRARWGFSRCKRCAGAEGHPKFSRRNRPGAASAPGLAAAALLAPPAREISHVEAPWRCRAFETLFPRRSNSRACLGWARPRLRARTARSCSAHAGRSPLESFPLAGPEKPRRAQASWCSARGATCVHTSKQCIAPGRCSPARHALHVDSGSGGTRATLSSEPHAGVGLLLRSILFRSLLLRRRSSPTVLSRRGCP